MCFNPIFDCPKITLSTTYITIVRCKGSRYLLYSCVIINSALKTNEQLKAIEFQYTCRPNNSTVKRKLLHPRNYERTARCRCVVYVTSCCCAHTRVYLKRPGRPTDQSVSAVGQVSWGALVTWLLSITWRRDSDDDDDDDAKRVIDQNRGGDGQMAGQ